MKKLNTLHIVAFAGLILVTTAVVCAQGNSSALFPGGDSDISGSDPQRADKIIKKWTEPKGKQGDVPLSGPPYFWNSAVVGRPVFLRIMKNSNRKGLLEVWLQNPTSKIYELFKTYRIFNFSGELGPKTKTGDLQAPEGFYYISKSRLNPASSYHLSMDMGYPNEYDRSLKRTGSHLMIHGSTPSLGCFAMTDNSIEQIYTLVAQALNAGQPIVRVHSFPFAMTKENMQKVTQSEHYPFWLNLKEGWDFFETKRQPPNVEVEDGRYVFESKP